VSIAMTQEEREAFLADVHVGIISIECPGRGPLTVPIWYGYEPGGALHVLMEDDSRKARLLKAAGRFSLCVQSEAPPYQFVSVEGPIVSVEPSVMERDERSMALRYLGEKIGEAYIEAIKADPSNGTGFGPCVDRHDRRVVVGHAGVTQPIDRGIAGLLVTHHGDVGGSRDPLLVEHGAVGGEVSVDPQPLRDLLARAGGVVRQCRGKARHHAGRRTPGRLGGRTDPGYDVALDRLRPREPENRPVSRFARDAQHLVAESGEQERHRPRRGRC
jgi:nitroimidazol reductase NimA-like FMN-containing flavoprotein (pyridoxamine 5'-phosphate oxidase superfamily)